MLPLLEPGLARAGCLTNAPRRALFVIWGNGMLPANARENWPTGPTETDFKLGPGMESLEPFKSDLVFIDKLDYKFIEDSPKLDDSNIFDGHCSGPGMLTGRRLVGTGNVYVHQLEATGPSLDQHLGAELAARGFAGIPSLYLGVRVDRPSYTVWRGLKDRIAPDWDPVRVFSKLFAGRDGVAPDPELERLQRARKSVLDSVSRDFGRFGRLLGTADRARIDRHLESIRSIEKELSAVRQPVTCKIPDLDPSLAGQAAQEAPSKDDTKIPGLLKIHTDLLVAALATDVVRVAVLQLGDTEDWEWALPWLGLSDSHHLIGHENGGREVKLKADAWLFGQWADLIGRLKNEKEGAKSMLDSTVVTFMNNMSNGSGHYFHDVPAFFAGSCGGYFKTGRNLTNRVPGLYHQPLLVSIANAMGVPLTTWGDPEYSTGEMPGLRG